MKTLDHDAIVIGAGPAGLLTASTIAAHGHDVVVLEEHPKVGEPDHCAGLLSLSGLRRLGLKPPQNVIQNTVHAARIYAPSGRSLLVERGRHEAVVVDRRKFDAWLAERAAQAHASIITGAKVRALKTHDDTVVGVETLEDGVAIQRTAIVTVNAEGAQGRLSASVGLPAIRKNSKYPAFQYEVQGADVDDDIVEMYYGRQTAPGFFAWIIPLGDGRVRVGLASDYKSKPRLEAVVRHHPIISRKLARASVLRRIGGTVLVGLPAKKTFMPGLVVVGDAAGMVKATTGGGVIFGGISGKIAGKTVSLAISERDASASSMGRYETSWRSLLLGQLRTMYLAQRAISSLSDRGLDSLVKNADELSLTDIVKRGGDMDMQGATIADLLANPRTMIALLRVARYISPRL